MYISYIHISYVIYVISLSISVYVWDYKYSGDGEATAQQIQRLKVDVFVVSHLFLLHCKMLWPRCTFVKSCKLALPNLTRNMSVVSTITPWISLSSVDLGRQWRNLANGPRAWTLSADGWWVCGYYCETSIHAEYIQNEMEWLYIIYNWLVVWNMNFIFPYIGNNHPNWLSYFSEGWLNHQPEKDEYGPAHCPSDPSAWIYGYFWHEQNHQNQTLSNGIGNLSLKLHEDICAWLKNAWLQYVTVFWLLQLWLDGYYSYI
jgi:hypothetical protein